MASNVIDIILLLLVLLSIGSGYRRGFILGVLDLAGWVLSLLAGDLCDLVGRYLGPRAIKPQDCRREPILRGFPRIHPNPVQQF